MPGGRASHKGTSNKPNVNAAGVIGEASDQSTTPEDLLPEEVTTNAAHRADQALNYPPATERPNESETSNEADD